MTHPGPDGWPGTDDVLQIHQLLAYYGHVLDDRDWAALPEVFTPDAVLDYTRAGAPAVLHGLEEVRAFFAGANHPSAHHTTNVVVVRRGGRVLVRSKFFVPYTRDTHVPTRWYGGTYDDVAVPTPAGWRLAARTCIGRWQLTPDQGPVPEHRRTW
ncbi:nuclear transport factor 2 family protein [Trujillonella humicola]|uniref:nuclear transport factor 2 family protein n=1 Tax=Trujillonella humicola TaxID=3383699 RepID=UPI0039065CD3